MQAGQKFGMQTMNQSLIELVQRRHISREEAFNRSMLPEELSQLAASGPSAPTTTLTGSSPFGKR
jgi:Tfp pilus assembly pilus retraction ATPase PilT